MLFQEKKIFKCIFLIAVSLFSEYRLVKEMCDEHEISIPDYHLYKQLMREYAAKDAETVAKEKQKTISVFVESEDDF